MTDTKPFMEENDVLKQFMELLNQQNMREQSQDFMELFKYRCCLSGWLSFGSPALPQSDAHGNPQAPTSHWRSLSGQPCTFPFCLLKINIHALFLF